MRGSAIVDPTNYITPHTLNFSQAPGAQARRTQPRTRATLRSGVKQKLRSVNVTATNFFYLAHTVNEKANQKRLFSDSA